MQPVYLERPGPEPAARFAILHPAQGARARGQVLYVHPLAEEMNKARRMVARQARRLASQGWTVLLPDRLGCGDSPGDAAQASWQAWVDDVQAAAAWLQRRESTAELWLWGLRAGALLALQAGASLGCTNYLLWQPQLAGTMALQQLLRLRVAALALAGGAGATVASVRQQIRAEGLVEVAGYGLSEGLVSGLEVAEAPAPPPGARVHWLEVAGSAELLPASRRVADAWRALGVDLQARAVAGPLFWQTTEIEDAPELWTATDAAMGAAP